MGRGPSFFVLVVLLAVPLLVGCLGESRSPVQVVSYLPLNDAQPGRATQFAFWVTSESQFKQDLPVASRSLPAGWAFEAERASVEVPGRGATSLVVTVTPDENATYGPHRFDVMVGDTPSEVTVNVKDLGREALRAGIGTQLYYVGWYDNGTLFGYNEPAVHARGIPLVPPGEPSDEPIDFTPLKVYVGGERGVPPPEPYNETGYRPVIPGFDARLRNAGSSGGMVAGETLAVRLAKEKAYTYAGNEEHVLYGVNLNFLIRIVSVDVLEPRPCTLPEVCPP